MRIRYSHSHRIDLDQLVALILTAGWESRARDRRKLAALVANSRFVVSAWHGRRLVGFARAISDGVRNAYVSTVAVLPEYRRQGIGREIVRRLVSGKDRSSIRWILHARRELHGFYAENGFQPAPDMLRRETAEK